MVLSVWRYLFQPTDSTRWPWVGQQEQVNKRVVCVPSFPPPQPPPPPPPPPPPWIPRTAFQLDSSCPPRATYAYLATVTSRAGTAARRLFGACYLPNPGSTATATTATSFHVEESRLLVVVSLTCLGFATQGKCHRVLCKRVALGDQLF